LSGQRERLARQRHTAELDRNDVRLRLGLHDRILAEAPVTTMDERLAGQVMLTLHREGRQADALRYFENVRARLAEELGADPGAGLRDVQFQILAAVGSAAPRQLPASPPSFSGRTRELAALGELLGTARTVAITGGGGLGKTWLALRWAHDHADRFPDGQLYVNLRGFDPAGTPVPPEGAIRDLLDGLGAVPASVPTGFDAQAALYRSMVANRRLLVVIDNARDSAQVVPLLPGSYSCTTLVTSRNQLTGLVSAHGASPLVLALLTDAEATDLLTRRLGAARVNAEPEAVQEIVRACAGLPLALGIAAARAATGPDLATLAAELRSARLDALDTGELTASLRAVFSVSYTALDSDAARACRLLARAPGVDIGLDAAGQLLDVSLLRRLSAAHLVREYQPGRFRMHDLVRLYMAEQAEEGDDAALAGLARHYIDKANAAMELFSPNESYRRPPHDAMASFATYEEAKEWLDAERSNLVAADPTGRLAWTLFRYLDFRAYYQDALTLHTSAVANTRPGRPEHGYALLHRGIALGAFGRDDEALAHHEQALRSAGPDTILESCAALGMATTEERRGDGEAALRWYEHALRVARENGHRHLAGVILNDLGYYHRIVGRLADAAEALRQSLDIAWELRDLGLGMYIMSNLGDVFEESGQQEKAIDHLKTALGIARELGNRGVEVDILLSLGRASGAPEYSREAAVLAREIGYPTWSEPT
jgi:tetratricopeptide (TPR) repeat protein